MLSVSNQEEGKSISSFKIFKAQVELEFENKIKCPRIDNRGEYTSDKFNSIYQQKSIKKKFTVAYIPQ